MTVIAEHARVRPSAVAIECGQVTLSYAEMDQRMGAWSQILSRLPFSIIGLRLIDPLETIILLFAGMQAGKAIYPLSTRLPKRALMAAAKQVRLEAIVARDSTAPCSIAPESLLGREEADSSQGEDPFLILATSGSTGVPKAAVIGVQSLEVNAVWANERLAVNTESRYLLSLPLYHVSGIGIVWRTFLAGGTVVLPSRGQNLAETLTLKKVTHMSMVTTQLRRLLRSRTGGAPADLAAVLVGGDIVVPSVLHEAYRRGYPVRTTYGLTEMASQVTTLAQQDVPDKLSTSGTLLPGRELCIGKLGEILLRGDVLFRGYMKGRELSLPIDENGWFCTGDTGVLDAGGHLTVTGRLDNMFVSGGENIWPEEIERVLMEHCGIEQAVVVPVPDPEFGCRLAGFVTLPGEQKSLRRIREEMEELLPRFKIPRLIPWEGVSGSLKADRTVLAHRAGVELAGG